MENKKNTQWLFPAGLFFGALLVLYVISSIETFQAFGTRVANLFLPVIVGLILAYVCNPLFRLLETRVLFKVRPFGLRRGLSLFLTYLALFSGIAILLLLIVPEIVNSVVRFLINYETYLDSAVENVNLLIERVNAVFSSKGRENAVEYLSAENIREAVEKALAARNLDADTLSGIIANKEGVSQMVNLASGFLSFAKNALFGFFVSLYFLSSKEKRYAQVMRARRSLFSKSANQRITKICTVANRAFGRYLGAQLVGSLFVGGLTYCVTAAFSIPYALLLSVSVGLLAFLPLVGPILAVLLAALILLLVEPSKILPVVLILILILQLNKRLVIAKLMPASGRTTSLCIVVAIATVGMVFGLPGLILGVPLFATVAELIDDFAEIALKKKNMPEDTAHYAANPASEIEPEEEENPEEELTPPRTSDIFELAKHYRQHRFSAIPPAEETTPETDSASPADETK